MNWHRFERQGWSWTSGWNGSYYAQAWRDLPQPVRIDGRWRYRECLTEFDKSLEKAEANLQQRLEQLEGDQK